MGGESIVWRRNYRFIVAMAGCTLDRKQCGLLACWSLVTRQTPARRASPRSQGAHTFPLLNTQMHRTPAPDTLLCSAWVARLAEQHGLALLTQRDLATQGAQPAPPPLLAVLVLGVPLTAPAIVARRTTASDLGYEG